jgi:hypothetical protein
MPWGAGPWDEEPDKAQWIDEATGLDCLLVRNNMGALCGYVGVPEGHPSHGQGYDDVAVEVHGGLTYADKCAGLICHDPKLGASDNVWWLGFDCAHWGDLVPSMEQFYSTNPIGKEVRGGRDRENRVYRDVDYVVAECTKLASQLKQMETHEHHDTGNED